MSEQAGGGAVHYGGFWIRVLAYIVDGVILTIVFTILSSLFGVGLVGGMAAGDPADMGAMSAAVGIFGLVSLIIGLAYVVGFPASKLQATPGKLICKLKVTDDAGNRLTILRSLGRELSKIISGIILYIGFIMVAFTDRKRGLHDMIASTQVVYR